MDQPSGSSFLGNQIHSPYSLRVIKLYVSLPKSWTYSPPSPSLDLPAHILLVGRYTQMQVCGQTSIKTNLDWKSFLKVVFSSKRIWSCSISSKQKDFESKRIHRSFRFGPFFKSWKNFGFCFLSVRLNWQIQSSQSHISRMECVKTDPRLFTTTGAWKRTRKQNV